MVDDSMSPEQQPPKERQGIRLTPRQWTILIVMGGVLLAIVGALLWIIRTGFLGQSVDVLATVVAGPTPTSTPPGLVPNALPTPGNLYWPPKPQPLATPHAPSDLLWWDARFAFRRRIMFDDVSLRAPAGMWARVIFDGEEAQREGKMRSDGADLRVLAWDGVRWWEIPRSASPRREKRGWNVVFSLQDPTIAQAGWYYLYYGDPGAALPSPAEGSPESSRLLLALDDEEGVEWGPEIAWTANSTSTQTLASPDGRVVIECPAGGLREDVLVRLRTVPVGERSSHGPLPDFELHADPPPGPPGTSKIAHWDPPLTVTINWAGLPVGPADLAGWTHFVYDEAAGIWYSLSVELDEEQGVIRFVTDQL
jgi:hypothetical protein